MQQFNENADFDQENLSAYTRASYFINSDNSDVINYAKKHTCPDDSPKEKAVKLYNAVRDNFYYDPYKLDFKKESMRAGYLINQKKAYCIEKAIILAAVYRSVGLPARVGFANVRNHIGTERLEKFLGTNLLVFHGYTQVKINSKWLKATPAFNKELCDKLNVSVLEFDAEQNSIFQEFDKKGSKYMNYEHYYGEFADLPYDLMMREMKKHYAHLFESEYYNSETKVIQF